MPMARQPEPSRTPSPREQSHSAGGFTGQVPRREKKAGAGQNSPIALRFPRPSRHLHLWNSHPCLWDVRDSHWGTYVCCNYPSLMHAQAAGSQVILRQAVPGRAPGKEKLHATSQPHAGGDAPCGSAFFTEMVGGHCSPHLHSFPVPSRLLHPCDCSTCSIQAAIQQGRAHPARLRTGVSVSWHITMTQHLHISMTHLTSTLVPSQLLSFRSQTSQPHHPVQQVGAQFTDVASPAHERA